MIFFSGQSNDDFLDGIDNGMSPEQLEHQPMEVMSKLTATALREFPARGEAGKYKKSWPQDSNRQVPDRVTSDEDVLSDLEAFFESPPEAAPAKKEPAAPIEE